jgi:hypothetical protein
MHVEASHLMNKYAHDPLRPPPVCGVFVKREVREREAGVLG